MIRIGLTLFIAVSLLAVTPAHALESPEVEKCFQDEPTPPMPWALTAVALTTFAETGAPSAYDSIAGSADGQGMSVGLLQWNFGQGTITEIVDGADSADVVAGVTMPVYGVEFLRQARNSAVTSSRADAVSWVSERQKATDAAIFRSEVKAFLSHPEIQKSQDVAAQKLATKAWREAQRWMQVVRSGCTPRFAQFAVFFDYLNHGGQSNSKEITAVIAEYGRVRDLFHPDNRVRQSKELALSEISWIMALPYARPCVAPTVSRGSDELPHVWDAQSNCAIWRENVESDQTDVWENEILIFAVMGGRFKPAKNRAVFINRKGTLALGDGVFNGHRCDFDVLYGDMDMISSRDSSSDTLSETNIAERVLQSCSQQARAG